MSEKNSSTIENKLKNNPEKETLDNNDTKIDNIKDISEKSHDNNENDFPKNPTPEEELVTIKDQLLRALAEVENTKKRASREKEETSQYVITKFARDILSIADNLDRAITSIKDINSEESTKLLDGIKLTRAELDKTLNKYQIKAISAIGKKFDHNFHQAVFEVEDATQEAGIITQEIQIGYTISDRLLRPAMVGVTKK